MIETDLVDYILNNTKVSYKARIYDDQHIKDVANEGLKQGDVAIRRRNGEFHGFAVEALEDAKPLLTDIRVAKAVKFLSQDNINAAVSTLHLEHEVQQYGLGILYEALRMWLEKNELPVPPEYVEKATRIPATELQNWVLLARNQPMQIPLKIVEIGRSQKGHSVVPEDWAGKKFANAVELHKAMDTLDWRKGKPPVTFCCSYSMKIREDYTWQKYSDFVAKFTPVIAIDLNFSDNSHLTSQSYEFSTQAEYQEWLQNRKDRDFLPYISKSFEKIIISCIGLENIRKTPPDYQRSDNIGLLVSRMQKAIRRGRGAAQLLQKTLRQLASAPQYSLPEQQFARVSGSRQMAWRLFICVVEDVEPYLEDRYGEYLSMLDLVSLAVLAHADPDIQFSSAIVDKIIYTALLLQHKDQPGQNWDWRKGKEQLPGAIQGTMQQGIYNALKIMPMMAGDAKMLQKSLEYLGQHRETYHGLDKLSFADLLADSNEQCEQATILASYDMHCLPNMLLQLQAALPFVPHDSQKHTTKALSKFIWDSTSQINVRNHHNFSLEPQDEGMLAALQDLQVFLDKRQDSKCDDFIFAPSLPSTLPGEAPSSLESRIAFMLVFGQKVNLPAMGKQKSAEIIVAGDSEKPCRAKRKTKYLDGKERFEAELRYVEYMKSENGVRVQVPAPPPGFHWIWGDKKNVHIYVKLIGSNAEKHSNQLRFVVENIDLPPFQAGPILKPIVTPQAQILPDDLRKIVEHALYVKEFSQYQYWQINAVCSQLQQQRKKAKDFVVYDWGSVAEISPLPPVIWRNIIAKLHNNYNDAVLIGPVDRRGQKLHESISYLYEGTLLRIFHLLSFLYPECIIPRGACKFLLDKNTSSYKDLIKTLQLLAFPKTTITNKFPDPVKIRTHLWDHQISASHEIVEGLVNIGKKGYGDASNVGAGKTLTALSVMTQILQHNIDTKNAFYSGFLVLLPTEKLYATWKDEIAKHTTGFDHVIQIADGTISGEIHMNTIVVTTLGRMRDHPLSNPWQLVVIDECLSVQNKNALQTEEAWRQVLCSQFGVIMMSATFFRSRFEKLFYMLKMLRSGLPEEKAYLDTILSECIICHIPVEAKKWISQVEKFELGPEMRRQYDSIAQQGLAAELLYNALYKYLYDHYDYIQCFAKVLENLTGNERALIYARSKNEADQIAQQVPDVSRYPDKTARHTVVSYAEGTYGLNDLVIYNTLVTRPPDPDKLPQMKGRLDRPGQQAEVLKIVYLLTKDTIDEAWLFRLEMANSFYKDHILPLAEFYEIAVGRKQIQ